MLVMFNGFKVYVGRLFWNIFSFEFLSFEFVYCSNMFDNIVESYFVFF